MLTSPAWRCLLQLSVTGTDIMPEEKWENRSVPCRGRHAREIYGALLHPFLPPLFFALLFSCLFSLSVPFPTLVLSISLFSNPFPQIQLADLGERWKFPRGVREEPRPQTHFDAMQMARVLIIRICCRMDSRVISIVCGVQSTFVVILILHSLMIKLCKKFVALLLVFVKQRRVTYLYTL